MALNYNVKGTGLPISDEIRTYIEKRLAHVEKIVGADSTAHIDVELQHQTSEDRPRYRAEFTFTSGSDLYRSSSFGESLHEAIDLAEGDLTRELSRNKQRNMRFVRQGAQRFKDFIRGFRSRF